MSTIAPTDANIAYSPYTWDVQASYAVTVSSGAYFKATIDGNPSNLSLLFDTSSGYASGPIWVQVDSGPWVKNSVSSSIPLNLEASWTSHTVTVALALRGNGAGGNPWSAPPLGGLRFAGFTSSSEISARKIYQRPWRGFAFGDSRGMGILTLGNNVNDARYGWAYLLADALGAELGIRAFGGVGYTQSGDGGVPPFGTIWNQLYDGKAADFATTPPDFIVTMSGVNDGGATDAATTSAVISTLNAMLAATPASMPIIMFRDWKGAKAAAQQAAIAGCSTPSRVKWVDTTGWWSPSDSTDGTHPYGYSNINELAPRMAAAMLPHLIASRTPPSRSFAWLNSQWTPIT